MSQRSTAQHCHIDTPFCTIRKSHVTWNFAMPAVPHSEEIGRCILNRPFAQLWPGNEVRGIAGEIRLRCVCFSLELSFFFCFGMSFSDHCCVPRFFNRGRASPSLFSRGFSQSSELRKRWLLAIRQAADWSHFRVPNNTVVSNPQTVTSRSTCFRRVTIHHMCMSTCRMASHCAFDRSCLQTKGYTSGSKSWSPSS